MDKTISLTVTDVTIRKATQDDIEHLVTFIARFVEAGKLLPRTIDELEELLGSFFLAEIDGQIVGTAALEIYSRKLAEIRSLAVDPIAQGRGVGRKLVGACVELAEEREIYEIMAISSSEDFFLNCGFDFTLPNERKAFFMQTREQL